MLFYFEEMPNQAMKGLMLGTAMLNIYINHLERGMNNILMTFSHDTPIVGCC